MKKSLGLFLAAWVACGWLVATVCAEEESGDGRDVTNEEWAQVKAEHLNGVAVPPEGQEDRYPGCPVCTMSLSCRSGYHAVGYTDMINFVVEDAWGESNHGPGGYNRLATKTIVENGVTVHDHVKCLSCDPN